MLLSKSNIYDISSLYIFIFLSLPSSSQLSTVHSDVFEFSLCYAQCCRVCTIHNIHNIYVMVYVLRLAFVSFILRTHLFELRSFSHTIY